LKIMTGPIWDSIIVGQGLAGTTLAWHLMAAGQRVLVLDAETTVTSSKIAAGLITPITGQRLALSWRNDEFLPVAREFYADIERRTSSRFFHSRSAVRLFSSETERQTWAKRLQQPGYQAHLLELQPAPLLTPDIADTSCGGFAMHAAQLDVSAYLSASRMAFAAVGSYAAVKLDWQRDISLNGNAVDVRQHRTRRLVSCEGYAAQLNPYFAHVPFNAAKGDILTVRFHRPMPHQSLHRSLWVAPTADPAVFRVGSSYNWTALDNVADPATRAELECRLKAFMRVPYTVLDHQAAVRPIIHLSEAVLGLHPQHERLAYFNGLGSKGALHAPWYARRFTAFLTQAVPLPDAINLRKFNRQGLC
jgi:glycine oxidase